MRRFLFSLTVTCAAASGQSSSYFPVDQPVRWNLKHASGAEFVFESRPVAGGVQMTARSPWGTSEWTLQAENEVFRMTRYGAASLADPPVFFHLDAPVGTSWTNLLGRLSVDFRGAVALRGLLYPDCVRIRHETGGASYSYVFAAGVGLIRYAILNENFDLDPTKSALPAAVPPSSLPPIGILPTPFANRPDTPQAAMERLALLSSLGCRLLLSYGDWTVLEPEPARFILDSVRFPAHESKTRGWKLAYTLSIIDMHERRVPSDLQHVAWDDPRMQSRVLALLDTILPVFGDNLMAFQFGNEVDTYLTRRPEELEAFERLFARVRAHVKARLPNVAVSTTLTSTSLPRLRTTWNGLWSISDALAITYGGYDSHYRAHPPSAIAADLAEILNRAEGKKIFFQEVAYPSAEGAGSSLSLQADFFRVFLRLLRSAADRVIGAQVMMLSDITAAWSLAGALGMAHSPAFVSVLGSLGLFDANAQPKPAFEAVKRELAQ
jgi:hypothetical protein